MKSANSAAVSLTRASSTYSFQFRTVSGSIYTKKSAIRSASRSSNTSEFGVPLQGLPRRSWLVVVDRVDRGRSDCAHRYAWIVSLLPRNDGSRAYQDCFDDRLLRLHLQLLRTCQSARRRNGQRLLPALRQGTPRDQPRCWHTPGSSVQAARLRRGSARPEDSRTCRSARPPEIAPSAWSALPGATLKSASRNSYLGISNSKVERRARDDSARMERSRRPSDSYRPAARSSKRRATLRLLSLARACSFSPPWRLWRPAL